MQSGPLLLTREGLAIRTGSAQCDAETLAWAAAASELRLLLSLAWCVCLSSLGACPALPPRCVGQAIACAVRGPRACVLARSFVMPQSLGGWRLRAGCRGCRASMVCVCVVLGSSWFAFGVHALFAVVASALVVFNSLAIDVNLPFSGVFRLESGTVAASLKNLRSATAPYLDEPPDSPSEVSALYAED